MEKFKPLSIEEFDKNFTDTSSPATEPERPRQSAGYDSLIPDIAVESAAPASQQEKYFGKKTQENAAVLPFPVEELPDDSAPAAAYSNVKPFPAARRTADFVSSINFDEYPEVSEPEVEDKRSAGNLAAKIVIIVLLAATLCSFVLGCFVSMFIDNPESDIGGYTFCTMHLDVMQPKLAEGDMIIVKKVAPADYVTGKLIAFNSPDFTGCRVHVISSSAQLTFADEYQIITTGYDGDSAATASITSNDVIGIVAAYVPNIGGILSFAMNNAILVCSLYVLLVVFWGLLLVLVERTKHKK